MADANERPDIPPPDAHQIERLNALYRIIDDAPDSAGLKARLALGARRLLGRVLSRQQEFNAVLVDHLNRNLTAGVRAHQKTIEWIEAPECDAPICVQAGVSRWCGTHELATIKIERQERVR